jgi:glycosyltransferase involved in cell wall biosynthesis
MLLRLVVQLQQRGVQNVVISLSKREPLAYEFEKQGVPVHTLDIARGWQIGRGLRQLRSLITELSPDVVQGWMYHANLAVSVVAPFLRKKTPVVWNIRRGLDDYRERKFSTRTAVGLSGFLSSRADRIIYCTHESRTQHESFGFVSKQGLVIGNGFDTATFSPDAEMRSAIRTRLGVGEQDILIGNIGRNDSAKGRSFLFDAFAELLRRVPHARLLLVGRGMEESNRELRGRLVTSRIAARVILIGEYTPISNLYPAMDIFCSSSVAEGFPNVVAEAMASGVPCVATDTGNTKVLLQGTGIVVPTRSAQRLAEGLVAMCEQSAEQRRARGLLARERITTSYSLSRIADDYVSLYAEVAEKRDASRSVHGQDSGLTRVSTVFSRT